MYGIDNHVLNITLGILVVKEIIRNSVIGRPPKGASV